MTRKRLALGLIVVVAFVAARRRSVEPPIGPQPLILERSFAITEKSILAGFTIDRVFGALIANSSAPETTPERLFRQMFDTLNPKPGLDASMPHCDDVLTDGKATLNGFVRRCPTLEGTLATTPYDPKLLFPVAIINRFDMADPAGANCGQYRLIFAKKTDHPLDTMNVIFEGVLPNPTPAAGIAACWPVAQFWAELSTVDSLSERRARLERFFFQGVSGFPALLRPEHFRDAPHGIRAFLDDRRAFEPRFYQFRVVDDGRLFRLFLQPDVLENLPPAAFFDARNQDPRAVRFRSVFLANVKDLAIPDVNRYTMNIPAEFLMGESNNGNGVQLPFVLGPGLAAARNTSEGRAFESQIQAELTRIGSTLTITNLINRAESQNCVGCHTISFDAGEGVAFPKPGPNFQHVAEDVTEPGEEGEGSRFAISPAMRDVFIPNRMRILTEFLVTGKAPTTSK